ESVAVGELLVQTVCDRARRVLRHLFAGDGRIRSADPGKEQPEMIVDFRLRADRRARIARCGLLLDGDGGSESGDEIGIRLVHPLEELPGIRAEALDVAALPFRINGIEGQRRFPGAGGARDDDQPISRKIEVDVLEVVLASASNDDVLAGRMAYVRVGGRAARGRGESSSDGGHKLSVLRQEDRPAITRSDAV